MSAKLDLSALKNVDFSKVLGVLKRRWILITCGLVIVLAPAGAWFGAGFLQAEIDESIGKSGKLATELDGYKRSTVTIRMPDGTTKDETAAINEAVIQRVREHNEALGKTSGAIYEEARKRNQAGHAFLPGMQDYLPKPVRSDEATRDILQQKWEQLVVPARRQFTQDPDVRGPAPASDALLRAQGAQQQFLAANRVAKAEELPAAEKEKLLDLMREARIQATLGHASGASFYLDPGAIHWVGRPKLDKIEGEPAVDALLVSLYRSQWDLWLVADLFKALKATNGTPSSPVKSPVKHLVAVDFDQVGYPKAAEGGSQTADAGEAGEPIQPDKDVPLDFKAGGLLGLVSNQLYDVRTTTVRAVVETASLPALVNELARCNLISVADLKLQPVDTFEALRKGYAYGPAPCSEVTLTLKSVWFRAWTTERMPVAMLKAIKSAGIPPKTESAEGAKPAAGQ